MGKNSPDQCRSIFRRHRKEAWRSGGIQTEEVFSVGHWDLMRFNVLQFMQMVFFRLCILDVEIDEGHIGWKIWKKELVGLVAFGVWNCIWIFKESLTWTFVLCFVCIRNFMRQCWWELVVVAGSLVTFFGGEILKLQGKLKWSPTEMQYDYSMILKSKYSY